MKLEKDRIYQAEIELGFFESAASNSMISGKLEDAGFTEVTVSGSGSDRTAKGRWAGETRNVELPDQVKRIL